jgi:flavin-binding protein dodecin
MGSVASITHISARSETSFEDAVRVGIERANATLRNVSGAWVKDMKVECTDGQITAFQVVMEVTFVLE